jgi:hypothetical protein
MEHASIVSFLTGRSSPETFSHEIAPEVEACLRGFERGVGSIIVGGGPATVITRDHAARLLRALFDERLSFDAANYLADGLIMSDDFDFADTEVADAIHFVADDTRQPTVAEMRKALSRVA